MIHEKGLHLVPPFLFRRDERRPAAAALVEHNRILRAILRHRSALRVRVRVAALGHEVHADTRGVVPERDERAVHDDAGREPVCVLVRDEEREAGVRGAVRERVRRAGGKEGWGRTHQSRRNARAAVMACAGAGQSATVTASVREPCGAPEASSEPLIDSELVEERRRLGAGMAEQAVAVHERSRRGCTRDAGAKTGARASRELEER
jgi:hypothetical protein